MRIAGRVFLFLEILSLCAPVVARAQAIESGVKAGLALTNLPHAGEVVDQLVGHPSMESSSKVGLTGGGYARFPITDRISFQPELLFVMNGVKLDETAGGGTVSARLNYLDVPLLIQLRMPINADATGYVLAGPSFAVKVATSLEAGQKPTADIDPAINRLDLGLAFGVGVEYRRYLVEVRYTAGLVDVGAPSRPHLDSLRNRAVSFLVGLKPPVSD